MLFEWTFVPLARNSIVPHVDPFVNTFFARAWLARLRARPNRSARGGNSLRDLARRCSLFSAAAFNAARAACGRLQNLSFVWKPLGRAELSRRFGLGAPLRKLRGEECAPAAHLHPKLEILYKKGNIFSSNST